MPNVVHCKHAKYDVYIGRPSPWGNPFEIGKDGNRQEVVEKYATWIFTQPLLIEKVKKGIKRKSTRMLVRTKIVPW